MDTAQYLSDSEMAALLAAPDRYTMQGRRNYALLLLLSETCAPAGEVTRLRIGDFALTSRNPSGCNSAPRPTKRVLYSCRRLPLMPLPM
jgi:integrase